MDHWNETVGGDGIAGPQQGSLNAAEKSLRRKTHDTIRRVTADIEQRQQLNTAVSALMELVNELYAFSEQTVTGGPGHRGDEDVEHAGDMERAETIAVVREALEALVLMLAPFAPHTAEELWCMLGYQDGLSAASWPVFDAEVAKADELTIPVQVNGKVRSRLTVPAATSEIRAREAGARRPGGAGAHQREDGAESRRREGPSGVDRREMRMRAALILMLALATSGCGYALAGRGSFLPENIRIVGIPPIENRSNVPPGRAGAHREGPHRVHRPREIRRS